MTLLSVRRPRVVAPPSRALRYLPATALVLDLAVVTVMGLLAVWGRRRFTIFDTPADVASSLATVGPLVVIGWLVLIAFIGGYHKDVFGAGTDEYKRVFRAGVLA